MSEAAVDPETGERLLVSGHGPEEEAHPGETHPGELQYIVVAVVLASITAVEVGVYYLDIAKLPMVLVLCALAASKFALVAMFFMHLKFDSPIFRRLFLVGIVLALVVYTITLLTFGVLLNDRNVHTTRRSPPAEQGSP